MAATSGTVWATVATTSAIAMLLLALTFAEISAMLPLAGGIARIPQFSHGNVVAMAEVEAMLRYLAPHAPWLFETGGTGTLGTGTLSWAGIAVAAAFLVIFVAINALGVKFFTSINSTITWAKIAIPLVVIAAFAASRFEPSNFVEGSFSPFGLKGILTAVGNGRFYVAPTLNRNQGGALYQSVPQATTAIARKPDAICTGREN